MSPHKLMRNPTVMSCTGTVMSCTVLYCTVLYCTVLYCFLYIPLQHTNHNIIQYCTVDLMYIQYTNNYFKTISIHTPYTTINIHITIPYRTTIRVVTTHLLASLYPNNQKPVPTSSTAK